jgi:hypothetical protein
MQAGSVAAALLIAGWSGFVAAQAPAPEATEAKPALRVEQINLDLGTVRSGQEAVGTFVFHNDGTEPIKILKAKPS